jgi:hypothetical protein
MWSRTRNNCVCVASTLVASYENAVTESRLNYFTHAVDGAVYGAWYRVNSPTQLEVMGVGMLESGEYGGFSPESTAKSILENFVRLRARMGAPIPSLETLKREQDVQRNAGAISPTGNSGERRSRT